MRDCISGHLKGNMRISNWRGSPVNSAAELVRREVHLIEARRTLEAEAFSEIEVLHKGNACKHV